MILKIEDTEKFKNELRALIKQEMDNRGLSLSDLAKMVEMNRSHVSDIINSDRGSLEKLLLVSKPLMNYEMTVIIKKPAKTKDHQD